MVTLCLFEGVAADAREGNRQSGTLSTQAQAGNPNNSRDPDQLSETIPNGQGNVFVHSLAFLSSWQRIPLENDRILSNEELG